VIRGRVQMVGFRAFTVEAASRLGVSGWVRNRCDGAVEVLAQGAPGPVEELLACLRRGPAAARVTSCEATPVAVNNQIEGFRVVA
jgi:acylphosphatase